MSNQQPLGVFDSGFGGLTAMRELLRLLPGEDIIYFGDAGRVPYGSRGRQTIIAYAKQDIAFLLQHGVKMVLAACGTVSSTLPAQEAAALPVPYLGVVQPAAAAAAAATQNGRVGVIATEATVASGSYQRALAALDAGIACTAVACPLFVPLVENGHFAKGDGMVRLAMEEYLPPLLAAGVDTLVLGCTHYPLLADALAGFMGPRVALIDSGRQAALAMRDALAAQALLREGATPGTARYYVSDNVEKFGRYADIFLGAPGAVAQYASVEDCTLPPQRH